MLMVGSALKGDTIAATDGDIGTLSDILFDDQTWKIRWLVVDAGSWLTARKVLLHPSAIEHGGGDGAWSVRLTKAQVKGSPDITTDLPVSRQMETSLYGYYGWEAGWRGAGYFGGYPYALGMPFVSPPTFADRDPHAYARHPDDHADPHLRSITAIHGYHIAATDGAIGHVENVLIDKIAWDIRYLIVDTRNWWPGRHVLLSPYAVRDINWSDRQVQVNVSRDQVKASPAWDPVSQVDEAYERSLHSHYGWPGYGF
jgi:sporulation protein YlmC with PRC-barrel domain